MATSPPRRLSPCPGALLFVLTLLLVSPSTSAPSSSSSQGPLGAIPEAWDGQGRVGHGDAESCTRLALERSVVVELPLGERTSRQAGTVEERRRLAEIVAQSLSHLDGAVITTEEYHVTGTHQWQGVAGNEAIFVHRKGSRLPYYGLQTPEALVGFVHKVLRSPVATIEGKVHKKAFEKLEQRRAVGFFDLDTQELRAYEEASSHLHPYISFFVVQDTQVANKLKLKHRNTVHFYRPYDSTPSVLSTTPHERDAILDFIQDNWHSTLDRLTPQDITAPWHLTPSTPVVLLFLRPHSPEDAVLFKAIKRVAKDNRENASLRMLLIDPDSFMELVPVWERKYSLDLRYPTLGVVDYTQESSVWFNASETTRSICEECVTSEISRWLEEVLPGFGGSGEEEEEEGEDEETGGRDGLSGGHHGKEADGASASSISKEAPQSPSDYDWPAEDQQQPDDDASIDEIFHNSETSDELSRCTECDDDDEDRIVEDDEGDSNDEEDHEDSQEKSERQSDIDEDSIEEMFSTSEQLTEEGDQRFPHEEEAGVEKAPVPASPHDEEGDLNSGGRPEGSGDARKKYVKTQKDVEVHGAKQRLKKSKYNDDDVTITGFIKDGVSKLFASNPPGDKPAASFEKSKPSDKKTAARRKVETSAGHGVRQGHRKVETPSKAKPRFDKKHRELDAFKITSLLRDGVANLIEEIRLMDTGENSKASDSHHHSHEEDITIEEAIQGLYNSIFAAEFSAETPEEPEEEPTVPPPTSPPPPALAGKKPKGKKDKYNNDDVTIKDAVRGLLSKLFGKSEDKSKLKKHTDEIRQMQKEKAMLINALKEQHSKMVQKKKDAKDDVTIKGFVSNILSSVFRSGLNGNTNTKNQQKQKTVVPEKKSHVFDKSTHKQAKPKTDNIPKKQVKIQKPEKKEPLKDVPKQKPTFKDMKKFSREAYAADHVTIAGFVKGLFSGLMSGEKKDEQPDGKRSHPDSSPDKSTKTFKDMKQFSREAYAKDHVSIAAMIKDMFSNIKGWISKTSSSPGSPAKAHVERSGVATSKQLEPETDDVKIHEKVHVKEIKPKTVIKQTVKETPESQTEEEIRFKNMKKKFSREAYRKDHVTIAGMVRELFKNIFGDSKETNVKSTSGIKKPIEEVSTITQHEIKKTKQSKDVPSQPKAPKDMKQFSRESYAKDHVTIAGMVKSMFSSLFDNDKKPEGETPKVSAKTREPSETRVQKKEKIAKYVAAEKDTSVDSKNTFKDMKRFTRKAYSEDQVTIGGFIKNAFSSVFSSPPSSKEQRESKGGVEKQSSVKSSEKKAHTGNEREVQQHKKSESTPVKDMKQFTREAYRKDDATISGFVKSLYNKMLSKDEKSEQHIKSDELDDVDTIVEEEDDATKDILAEDGGEAVESDIDVLAAPSPEDMEEEGIVEADEQEQEEEDDDDIMEILGHDVETPTLGEKEIREELVEDESDVVIETEEDEDSPDIIDELQTQDIIEEVIGENEQDTDIEVALGDQSSVDVEDDEDISVSEEDEEDDDGDIKEEEDDLSVIEISDTIDDEADSDESTGDNEITEEDEEDTDIEVALGDQSLEDDESDETVIVREEDEEDEDDDTEEEEEEEEEDDLSVLAEDDEEDENEGDGAEESESDEDEINMVEKQENQKPKQDDAKKKIRNTKYNQNDVTIKMAVKSLFSKIFGSSSEEKKSQSEDDHIENVKTEIHDKPLVSKKLRKTKFNKDDVTIKGAVKGLIGMIFGGQIEEHQDKSTDEYHYDYRVKVEEKSEPENFKPSYMSPMTATEYRRLKSKYNDDDVTIRSSLRALWQLLFGPSKQHKAKQLPVQTRETGSSKKKSVLRKTVFNRDDVTIKDFMKRTFRNIFGGKSDDDDDDDDDDDKDDNDYTYDYGTGRMKDILKQQKDRGDDDDDDDTVKHHKKEVKLKESSSSKKKSMKKNKVNENEVKIKDNLKPSYMSPGSATEYRKKKSKYNDDDVTIIGSFRALWRSLFGSSKKQEAKQLPVQTRETGSSKKKSVLRKTVFNRDDVTIKDFMKWTFRKMFGGKSDDDDDKDDNDYTYDYGTGRMKDILKMQKDRSDDDGDDDNGKHHKKEVKIKESSSSKKKSVLRKTKFNKDDVTIKGGIKSIFRMIFGGKKDDDDDVEHSDYDYGTGAYKREEKTRTEEKERRESVISKKKSVLRKTKFNKNDVTISGAVKNLFRKITGGQPPVEDEKDGDYEYDYKIEIKESDKESSDHEKNGDLNLHTSQKKKFQKHTKFNKNDVTIKGAVKGMFQYIFGTSKLQDDNDDDDDDADSNGSDDDSQSKQSADDENGGKQKADVNFEKKRRAIKTKYNANDVTIKDAVKGLFRTLFGGAPSEPAMPAKQMEDDDVHDDDKKPGKTSKKSKKKKKKESIISDSGSDDEKEKSDKKKKLRKSKYNEDDVTISGAIINLFTGGKSASRVEEDNKDAKQTSKAGKKEEKRIDDGDDGKPSSKTKLKQEKKKADLKKIVKSAEGGKKVAAEEIRQYHENDIKISTMIVDGVKSMLGQNSEKKTAGGKKEKKDLEDGISEREKDTSPAASDTNEQGKGSGKKEIGKKKILKVDKKKDAKKSQSVAMKAGPKVVPIGKAGTVQKSAKAAPPVKLNQAKLKVSKDEDDDIDKIFADSNNADQIFKMKEKKRLEEEAKKGPTGGRAINDRGRGDDDDDDDDDWDWNENFEFVENIVKRFMRFFHSFKFR